MEDEATTPSGDAAPEPAPASPSMMAGLSSGERLLVLGAILLSGNYVLFELILNEYFMFTGTLLVAVYALSTVWTRQKRTSATRALPYGWLLRVLGYTAGFLGAIELLTDLRFGVLDRAGDVIGGLIGYTGAFLMFWGGRQIQDRTT